VNLDETKSRFQSDDFIPTLARFKFALKGSDSVKENLSQEFDTPAERADTTLLVFQRDMKDCVEKTVDLEIKVTHNALFNTFCAAVGALGITFAMNFFGMNSPTLNPRISWILVLHTIEAHHATILKHSRTEINNFFPAFKSATEDAEDVHVMGMLLDGDVAVVHPHMDTFEHLLEALLVRNWDEHLKVKEDQHRQIEIKKFVDFRMTVATAADVAMDLEDPNKREELTRDLISKQVSQSNKKLQNEINRLSAKLQKEVSKNDSRGTPKSSALSTKQTDKATKTTQRQPSNAKAEQGNALKAAGPANDSTKSNKNNGSAQKSRRNNANSSTNRRSHQKKQLAS
jgi:hypothetical protein